MQIKEININCVMLIIIKCEPDQKSTATFPLSLATQPLVVATPLLTVVVVAFAIYLASA